MNHLSLLEQKDVPTKEVAKHARPHIETHVRSKGHSSVAGAAYRLGLKLLDERTGTWHDYSRRSTAGEIILALTLALAGSPHWATRPQELWTRVENSERRKDSQGELGIVPCFGFLDDLPGCQSLVGSLLARVRRPMGEGSVLE